MNKDEEIKRLRLLIGRVDKPLKYFGSDPNHWTPTETWAMHTEAQAILPELVKAGKEKP